MYHGSSNSLARSHQHYRTLELSSKLESADPHGLVCILYDELLRSLDVIAATLKHERCLSENIHSNRANSILLALSASLDFANGQRIADLLMPVYRAMMLHLTQVIDTRDAAKLAEMRSGLIEISTAWNAIKP